MVKDVEWLALKRYPISIGVAITSPTPLPAPPNNPAVRTQSPSIARKRIIDVPVQSFNTPHGTILDSDVKQRSHESNPQLVAKFIEKLVRDSVATCWYGLEAIYI